MGVTTVIKDYGSNILDAIRENDLRKLRHILERHLNHDAKIAEVCTTDIRHRPTKKFACPLILAARQPDPSILQYMLERGVNPNFVHHTVYTSKRREMVTALHVAVDLSLYDSVEALLNHNADANIFDHNNETALHVAVRKADCVMTHMLLAKGADPSAIDRHDNASLHVATLFGHLQLVKMLLKYDADVYQRGAKGAIPSHIAAREGHIHLIQVFCARDAGNINVKIPCFADNREVAPLHLAAENGHVETVIALLDQFKADVGLKDSDGNTTLHCVVLQAYHPYKMRDRDYFYATAKVLVRYHVSINDKNGRGNTALHLAAAHHHPKIVELLLTVGANPFTENDDRSKPVDLVPESDSVTRQMLKSAMANPRPAPLDASMLSIRHDLHNLSMMPGITVPQVMPRGGPKPAGTLVHESSIPNGIPPGFAANMPGANRSFRSVSSMSSVFMDDTKARIGALQMPQQGRRDQERNNAIPLYTPVDKPQLNTSGRHGHGTGSHHTSLDRSVIPPSPSRGETKRKSGRGKAALASPNNRDSERSQTLRSAHGKVSSDSQNNHDSEMSQMVEKKNRTNRQRDSSAAAMPPVADRSSRKHRQPSENISLENSRDQSSSGRKSRSKKDKRPKDRSSKAAEYGVADEDEEIEDLPSGYYEDDAGVKVHTVPGKPSTIEVEYTGGPIMISVDTQGDSLESLQTRQTSDCDSSSSSSSSSSSDEVRSARHNRSVDALERKKKKKKKKHKKKHREQEVQSADEILERRDRKKKHRKPKEEPIYENVPRKKKDRDKGNKSADEGLEKHGKRAHRRSEDMEPVYENQAQVLAEMRRQQEERAVLEEQQRLEQERLERDAERERVDEAEAKRLRQEERDQRKAKKLQRRQQRQNIEELEPPVFLDAKPSLSYPKEMWVEPEYDSDDVENEQQRVAENAKRKAIAATHSLIQRWSEAEDDQEPQAFSRGGKYSSVAAGGVNGAYEKPKKPPRPAVSPQQYEADVDLMPSPVATEDNASNRMQVPNPIPKPRTTISQSKPTEPDKRYESFIQERENMAKTETDERYETVAKTKEKTESDKKYETVMHEMEYTTKIELTTVPVINQNADQASLDDAKWVDAKLMEQPERYAEEVVIADDRSAADPNVATMAEHRGLKMRVTGEMPKAYTRGEKDSARKAFMLAAPVSIETSSEASDSELSSPQHSAPEPTALWDHVAQREAEVNDEMEPLPPTSASKPGKLPLYAKPYKSFGKIEPKVDALEEALKEEELKKKNAEQQVPVPNIQASTTATVNRVVVPRVNHIVPENLVSPAGRDQTVKHSTYTVVPGTPVVEGLSSSSSSSDEEDVEQFKKEAGSRQPDSRSCSEDLDIDLEEYNEEPGRKKHRRGTKSEDQTSRKVDSRLPDKKTGKKGLRLEVSGENRSRSFADQVQKSPGLSEDVWNEAMAGVPIASSESFDMRLLSKDRSAGLDDDGDDDAFERRGRRKGKPARSNDRVNDLKWTADLPINDSLSRETLDDISCDSYVPPQQITGWDVDSLEVDLDEYIEEGTAKVLDMLAQSSDSAQGRVVGRRKERVDRDEQRKKTLSTSFETNVDDIEFDTEPQGSVPNINKGKQSGRSVSNNKVEGPPVDTTGQNVSNINKTKQPQTGKAKEKRSKIKEPTEDTAVNEEDRRLKHPAKDKFEPEEEEVSKEKVKKRRQPVSKKRLATIPIMAADAAAGTLPFEEGEDSYSDEPKQDLSADINIRLWQGPTTNIDDDDDDDDDLLNEGQNQLFRNLHDQRLEEDSIAASDEERLMPAKPPTARLPQRDLLPESNTLPSTSDKAEILDRLPDRPRRSQPIAPGDSQSSRQRRPTGRTVAHRPYNAYMSETEAARRHDSSGPSDTESIGSDYGPSASRRLPGRAVYSEAEASDFEAPQRAADKTVRQSAMDALRRGPRRKPPTAVLVQPGHHDKNFHHIRQFLRPPKKRVRGLTCVPSIGHYRDSLLSTSSSRRSLTESEVETDDNVLDRSRGGKPLDQYDIIAKLWMEQVDAKAVKKSSTMFLSVLPPGRDLPHQLTTDYRHPDFGEEDPAMPPQWVIARGRTMQIRKQNRRNADKDLEPERSASPGRQLILFFKVGGNWMDVAWVLFDGLQTDPETVRMIRDIQLKNPGGLSDQVHDLMHRWWQRRGHKATIAELQQALDDCRIAYIPEEFLDRHGSFVAYTDTEDDLDVGQVSETDPNVSRLIHEYNTQSANASFEHPPAVPTNPPPQVLHTIQQAASRAKRLKSGSRPDVPAKPAVAAKPKTKVSSSRSSRSSGRELMNAAEPENNDDGRRVMAIVYPQPSMSRNVTNL